MLTLLAAVGLVFIILVVYRRGKRDGIKDAVDFFLAEMERKSIAIEVIDGIEKIGENEETPKVGIRKRITHLIGRIRKEQTPEKR
jgi:hypothetical protein